MSNIKCKKCGEFAYSKCPYCRNIFPEDQIVTFYSNMITVKQEVIPADQWVDNLPRTKITFSINTWHVPDEKETPEQQFLVLLKGLLKLEYPERALCNHRWEFLPGESSSIGCGHHSNVHEDGTPWTSDN